MNYTASSYQQRLYYLDDANCSVQSSSAPLPSAGSPRSSRCQAPCRTRSRSSREKSQRETLTVSLSAVHSYIDSVQIKPALHPTQGCFSYSCYQSTAHIFYKCKSVSLVSCVPSLQSLAPLQLLLFSSSLLVLPLLSSSSQAPAAAEEPPATDYRVLI